MALPVRQGTRALPYRIFCRRGVGSAPPNGPVLLSPGRTRPLQAAPGKPPRPQKNAPPWGAFFSLKKPRRVCRPQAANQMQSIFCRGVYLAKNTSRSASVEFVRHQRTNYARGRLQAFCPKRTLPFLGSLEKCAPVGRIFIILVHVRCFSRRARARWATTGSES